MAVALVAGLECFYTCPDWTVRGICNSALARIVYENEGVFLEEDHLAAIWNLFFSINSIPLISKVFPDRVVIIKALGLLAPLYSLADTALTYRIIDTLLRLKDKVLALNENPHGPETEAIQGTLRNIFEKLSEKPAVGTPGSTPPTASTPDTGAGGTVVSSGGGAGTHGSDIMGTGYTLFMNLLNPNDESAYNLLPWALETYTATLLPNPPQSSKQKKYPVKDFPPLTNFIQSLSNHFRATPALVRYGACVCLHAALTICPTLVADHKELYVFVVAGALDTGSLSAFLYMSMLETIEMPEGVSLKEIIGKLRHAEYDARNYDAVFGDSIISEDGGKHIRLADVLDLAVKGSPAMPPKQLHKIANSLEYLSKQMKLKQLEMIRLWGSKTEKFDTFLMQTLIPFSGSPDEEIQMATIKVLRSLMPGFKTATGLP
ncbi:hypothetical protein HK104_004560 [Borealophlyctis nickersoniae]|nr:hypothetical protein HK104_004560 [Borealophlyctis nickersoniae]